MSLQENRHQEREAHAAETDKIRNSKTLSSVPLMSKQHVGDNVASVQAPLKRSSEDPDQRDHRVQDESPEQNIASPRQTSAELAPSLPAKHKKIAVDSISADQDASDRKSQQLLPTIPTYEQEDDQFPPQLQNIAQTVSRPESSDRAGEYYCSNCRPGLHYDTTTKESPTAFKKFTGYILSKAQSSPARSDLQHRSSHPGQSPQQLQVKRGWSKQTPSDELGDFAELKQNFKMLKGKETDWAIRERELRDRIEQMQGDYNRIFGQLQHNHGAYQAKIRQVESEKQMAQEKYDSFIRKQQEESFRQMTSARWLPVEESKVRGDLDRLKRDMRRLAKGISIDNIALLQVLEKTDYVALLNDLKPLVLLDNNQLPQELLSTPKSAALLLNALLTYSVYTKLFENPFFFLEDGLGHTLPRLGMEHRLNRIYQDTQYVSQEDAHVWRSQTLRLLLPPLRNDTSKDEKTLRGLTEEWIAQVAVRHASNFLEGAARHLISEEAQAKCGDKVRAIYQEAGTLSYRLWTKRTAMRCSTLEMRNRPLFDPDSKSHVPHTAVKYEDHEDQLKGRPICLILHPLLEVHGTDDAMDYDLGRVWAPAEVWLDSRKPSTD